MRFPSNVIYTTETNVVVILDESYAIDLGLCNDFLHGYKQGTKQIALSAI